MSSKKSTAPTENAALLPTSSPPPYEEHAPQPSSSSQAHLPAARAHAHALGPTPVSSLPAPPPAVWHAGAHSHARADARARRRFCGALCCAVLVWLVAGAVFGAVLGEQVARGGDGWYAVGRPRGSGRAMGDEAIEEVSAVNEKAGEWVWVEGAAGKTVQQPAVSAVPPRPDYAAE